MLPDIRNFFWRPKSALLIFHFVFLGFISFSCRQNESTEAMRVFPEYGVWMDSLLLSKEKIVRGVEPGSDVSEILLTEKRPVTEQDSSSIYFEFAVDSVTAASVNYQISSDIIQEIEISITSTDQEKTSVMLSDLEKYFTLRFGAPVSEKGIAVFSAVNSGGDNIKISLEDISSTNQGKISVLVYSEK